MSNTQSNIVNKFTGTDYLSATGKIPHTLTNDYIFRIVFQENKYALKGLLCSILGLKDDEIVDLEITNEIIPGVSITDKEYRMDIVVKLNDKTTINLEMQINNYNNWEYRSLGYLCREYDNLDHGDNYDKVKTAYQIGFLDFTLFPDHPEFFAKYQMRNALDNHLYTDRLNLIVISLNQINLATDDDKARGIDTWARLFKSKTWEELKMVANTNEYMTSAVESLYVSNNDRNIAKVAKERSEFLRSQAYKDKQLKMQASTIATQQNTISKLIAQLKANGIEPDI